MKHRGNYTTSLLFIFLLITIGMGGKLFRFFGNNSLDQNQFHHRFCLSQEVKTWPPAKRQLCNRGVYINTDNATALEHLPNIGPTRARAIVEYRNAHGSFKRLDELKNVKGIGPNTIATIKPWIEDVPTNLVVDGLEKD